MRWVGSHSFAAQSESSRQLHVEVAARAKRRRRNRRRSRPTVLYPVVAGVRKTDGSPLVACRPAIPVPSLDRPLQCDCGAHGGHRATAVDVGLVAIHLTVAAPGPRHRPETRTPLKCNPGRQGKPLPTLQSGHDPPQLDVGLVAVLQPVHARGGVTRVQGRIADLGDTVGARRAHLSCTARWAGATTAIDVRLVAALQAVGAG